MDQFNNIFNLDNAALEPATTMTATAFGDRDAWKSGGEPWMSTASLGMSLVTTCLGSLAAGGHGVDEGGVENGSGGVVLSNGSGGVVLSNGTTEHVYTVSLVRGTTRKVHNSIFTYANVRMPDAFPVTIGNPKLKVLMRKILSGTFSESKTTKVPGSARLVSMKNGILCCTSNKGYYWEFNVKSATEGVHVPMTYMIHGVVPYVVSTLGDEYTVYALALDHAHLEEVQTGTPEDVEEVQTGTRTLYHFNALESKNVDSDTGAHSAAPGAHSAAPGSHSAAPGDIQLPTGTKGLPFTMSKLVNGHAKTVEIKDAVLTYKGVYMPQAFAIIVDEDGEPARMASFMSGPLTKARTAQVLDSGDHVAVKMENGILSWKVDRQGDLFEMSFDVKSATTDDPVDMTYTIPGVVPLIVSTTQELGEIHCTIYAYGLGYTYDVSGLPKVEANPGTLCFTQLGA